MDHARELENTDVDVPDRNSEIEGKARGIAGVGNSGDLDDGRWFLFSLVDRIEFRCFLEY